MGESIAEGTLVRWMKKVGDTVDRDEPLFEISTDKVDAEIPSPAAGVLTAINVREGETAAVNSVVATIAEASDASAAAVSSPSPIHADATPSGLVFDRDRSPASTLSDVTPAPVRRQRLSPLVRRLMRDLSVDVAQVAGTGLGGRVTKTDILRYVERRSSAPAPAVPVALAWTDRVEAMSVMRRKIAEHMVLSKRTSAHVHSVFHVNVSVCERLREAKKGDYERAGTKLTFMAFVAKATVDAIRLHPVMNASIDGTDIVYKKDVNLGIAVALDAGLIVPVIKNAGEKTTLELARAIADVGARARSKRLNPEEVTGGTFTITNPGRFGAQFGLPIINQPQVAILGIGTVEKRPVVIDDAIGIRSMCYLTLGFDHRLIDGAVADAFMAEIKTRLETFDAKDV
jgi:2-oxoglutarate dehydrogenase E2 component (dihydrolipoamide succinyltransferase)